MPGGMSPRTSGVTASPRRGVFILNHLLQRDPIKFVYVMDNLYRAASIDAGEITASQWKTILKTYGRH